METGSKQDQELYAEDIAEVLAQCETNPHRAFLTWQMLEETLDNCSGIFGQANERKFRAAGDAYREWFEDQGNWRKLDPNSKTISPGDHIVYKREKKLIQKFIEQQQNREKTSRPSSDALDISRETARLLNSSAKRKFKTVGPVDEEEFRASAQFKNIFWRKQQYTLAGNASKVIEAVYIAHKSYEYGSLHQNEIFREIYGSKQNEWPAKPRIQNYFRTGDAKRLWDDGFIGHDNKGNFHLNIKIHTDTH